MLKVCCRMGLVLAALVSTLALGQQRVIEEREREREREVETVPEAEQPRLEQALPGDEGLLQDVEDLPLQFLRVPLLAGWQQQSTGEGFDRVLKVISALDDGTDFRENVVVTMDATVPDQLPLDAVVRGSLVAYRAQFGDVEILEQELTTLAGVEAVRLRLRMSRSGVVGDFDVFMAQHQGVVHYVTCCMEEGESRARYAQRMRELVARMVFE